MCFRHFILLPFLTVAYGFIFWHGYTFMLFNKICKIYKILKTLYMWRDDTSQRQRSCIKEQRLFYHCQIYICNILLRCSVITFFEIYLNVAEHVFWLPQKKPLIWRPEKLRCYKQIREDLLKLLWYHLQSFTKYVWNLLGFTEILDLK